MENEELKKALECARLEIRAQTTDSAQLEGLADFLRKNSKFHYAGELFKLMLLGGGTPDKMKTWNKKLAFCLYKDPDQPSSTKFDAALHYLGQAVSLKKTRDAEYLGTAGAIYKRKWQYDNRFENLVSAEHFYRRGYESWKERHGKAPDKQQFEGTDDNGYTAINYAFMAELLAFVRLKETAGLSNDQVLEFATTQLEAALETRRYIITRLLDNKKWINFPEKPVFENKIEDKWICATLAEAYFGIGEYQGAIFFYKKYHSLGIDGWQAHSTAEQLMRLAEIQSQISVLLPNNPDDKSASKHAANIPKYNKKTVLVEARKCLEALYPDAKKPGDKTLSVSFRGKVGLGLSGGGCRAALFHVGVLARLAELDVLRHIEVLSCVSGGSIAGAYYYMLLKREIERHGDNLNQMHYIGIVREMETAFLEGIQKNLRWRIFLNPVKNLRMFFDKSYTRTHRLGELYENHFYQKIIQNTHPEGKPILMHDLLIRPGDISQNHIFNIKTENWNRENKVPILALNATSLNTGHNWQFTASWMGEPPGTILRDVDTKKRLRRMYYNEAPAPYKSNVRLGHAVGASSCVPVLFEPLRMPDLYPGIDLQLVDGGVHDNLGVASLLEQECKVILISDATGQLSDKETASSNPAAVFGHSSQVMQERVREGQFYDLKARATSAQLTALMFVHLKKELHQDPVNWLTCEEPQRTTITTDSLKRNPDLTNYKIRRDVQAALAELRTDLDAFNDAEAYALMYSGYAQTKLEMSSPEFEYLKTEIKAEDSELKEAPSQTWKFMDIEERMRHVAPSKNLLRRLRLGQSMSLKAFYTNWLMSIIGVLLGLGLLGGLVYLIFKLYWGELFAFGLTPDALVAIGWFVLGYLATLYLDAVVTKAMNWQNTLLKMAGLFIAALGLSVISGLYLLILNPIYLSFGKLNRLDREDALKKFLKRIWDFIR